MRKHRRFFLAMKLRNYQKKALAKAHCWFKEETTYPLIVLPTGAGKTVVFTTLIKELYLANPEKRFLILAHRQELISQAVDKLLTVWPDAPVGILAASLKKFNQTAPIVVASRDTLASKKRLEKSYPFDYIIIDEAHHVGPQMSSRYRKIIDHFEEIGCPKIMGVTATPYRMGQGYIYGMDDHFFGGIAYKATIPSLIKQGYLSRLSSFKVNNDAVIDASKARVKFKGGDYRESDLEALAIVDDTIYAIINDWLEKAYLKGRKSTVFFCVSVLHANKMALFLQNQGVSAACVTAETPMDEREDILGRFEEGTLSALCNVAVLTEGWDAPRTDCIALLRPTKSLGLYVQICGRGMRPWPDKDDCLLLDYGGNMGRHGCIDVARPERNKKDDEVVDKEMIWICDECLSVNDIDDKNCRECEALKPLPPVSEELETIKDEVGASETIIAAEGNVLSDELGEADIIEVQEAVEFVRAERAVSKNGNDYLKIMFKTEENYWPRSTALMMTMNGKPRAVAEKKWRIMSRGFDLPYSIESAVQMVDRGALLEIKKVNLRKEGRYWNVIGVTF
jgi:DNA repair protein RadD